MPDGRRDWKAEVRRRLRTARVPVAREAEIVEELAQHMADRHEQYLAEGMDDDDAARRVLQEIGDSQSLRHELQRVERRAGPEPLLPHVRGFGIEAVWRDLRHAARGLRKSPGFTATAVFTLALGIGANGAVFSIINAVLLRPLPYPHSGRLMALYTRYLPATGYDFPYFALSGPEFGDLRSRIDAFAAIGAFSYTARNLNLADGGAERVLTMPVTAGFFEALGVRPQHGRPFTEDEAQRGEGCVAVIGHDLWTRQFAARADAIGSTIRLDDAPCRVLGVMPESFGFRDERVALWTTLAIDTDETPINRQSHPLLAVARLRDGVTPEQADAQLRSLAAHWSDLFPPHYAKGHFAVIRPLHEDLVGDQRQALLMLAGAVLFVLLIVCVNLAALLLSRGEGRRREFALRRALGADRRQVIRQLLSEAMLLALGGGLLGILFATGMLAGLLGLYPERLPVWWAITVDRWALLFSLAVAVPAGFFVGLVPALHATGVQLQETLKADARAATATRRSLAARAALVVGQLALSIVLLVGAILMIRTYQHLQRTDLGFDPDGVLTFTLSVPAAREQNVVAARRMLAAIEDRLAAAPGADTAGAASNLPLASAGPPDDFVIEGRPAPAPGAPTWNARYLMVTPRLFSALRIPLKRGRLLSESDTAGQPLVAVVNETAARLYWAGDNPVGRLIRYYPQETSPSLRIVGVVGDVRALGVDAAPPPAVYVPFEQAPRPAYPGRSMTFVVRSHGSPNDVISSARAAVASVDSGLPLANVRPMSAVVAAATGQPRFTTYVMSFFAGMAFGLAALGLYGTLAYTVEQRVREMGVRIALGAGKRQIVRLIVGQGMGLAASGIAVGVPAALALTQIMAGLLSGVTSTDRLTYLVVVVMLAVAALVASYLPARRATRVDPMVALRGE